MATIVRSKKVRQGVTAYQYLNGTINIGGVKFLMHSMTSAIKKWRQINKL